MPIATEVSPRGATQEAQRGSPAPQFEVEKPRGRSLSPVRSRAAAAAAQVAAYTPAPASTSAFVPAPAPTPASTSTSPETKYVAPPLTWRTAAADAKAGIYYTKDEFPTSSFLPPPFSREPVRVMGGERVELLEEVDEYAVRVRVLRTGLTGLIPAWNTEGALDRLTRINTAFNEAATCPAEARALRRRFSESAAWNSASEDAHHTTAPTDPELTHAHSRCIPFATRVRFGDHYSNPSALDDSSSSDSDDPDSPMSPTEQEADRGRAPGIYRAPARTLEKGGISASMARARSAARKSVVFPQTERPQVVFRYPSEELVEVLQEEKRESSVEEDDGEDEEWWWHGWEEPLEESESESEQHDGSEDEGERTGPAKVAGQDVMQSLEGGDLSRWLVAIQEEEH